MATTFMRTIVRPYRRARALPRRCGVRFRRMTGAMRVVAVTIVALAAAGSASAATVVHTWFPAGSQLRYGVRAVDARTPLASTLRTLLAGPTPAETRGGARTAFAHGTRLLGLRRQGSLVTIQFDRRFLLQTATGTAPVAAPRLRLRILQLGRTLSQFPAVHRFRISVSGQPLADYPELGLRWRPGPDGTWTLAQLAPSAGAPLELELGSGGVQDGDQIRLAQTFLAASGWLDPSEISGALDYATSQALTAFEAWHGLVRDGALTATSFGDVLRAARPTPRHTAAGRAVEVYRDLGVLLLVENGRVVRAVHTSTGFGGRTPSGSFHVYRKEQLSWSVPFKVWMPWASYFVGGIAMHAYPYVPAYAASHGCVRLPAPEAQRVYAFAVQGTPVYVY
jgi:L,D-transpeptidase-like protein/sporulation and spore germination protein/putative peptidoglycan binding protein